MMNQKEEKKTSESNESQRTGNSRSDNHMKKLKNKTLKNLMVFGFKFSVVFNFNYKAGKHSYNENEIQLQ